MRSWPAPALPTLPGHGPGLRLGDTATGGVVPVAPGSVAGMYVCGITPYDATHLGHAATYVTFDLVGRVLRDSGHEVRYVQNVTDIDDPLLERAARDGADWRALGGGEIELFRRDMTALRVVPPTDYVGAVESIPLVIEFVRKLLAAGAAYTVDDPVAPDVYFRVGASERFGYVSNLDEAAMSSLFAERGGDPGRWGKEHPMDALLWRAARPGEPSWPSPMGPGRPGWHIECAAIALDRLGIEFDIQGGGGDLPFPHHEYCAAHAETVHAERHFARLYVHTGMIGLRGEKMSKSRGNLVKVSELLAGGTDPSAIRLALSTDHYRTDRDWTAELLATAEHRLGRWRAAVARPAAPDAGDLIARLRHHLANDLDTPKAIAALDYWAERALTTGGEDSTAGPRVAAAVDALLGIDLR